MPEAGDALLCVPRLSLLLERSALSMCTQPCVSTAPCLPFSGRSPHSQPLHWSDSTVQDKRKYTGMPTVAIAPTRNSLACQSALHALNHRDVTGTHSKGSRALQSHAVRRPCSGDPTSLSFRARLPRLKPPINGSPDFSLVRLPIVARDRDTPHHAPVGGKRLGPISLPSELPRRPNCQLLTSNASHTRRQRLGFSISSRHRPSRRQVASRHPLCRRRYVSSAFIHLPLADSNQTQTSFCKHQSETNAHEGRHDGVWMIRFVA